MRNFSIWDPNEGHYSSVSPFRSLKRKMKKKPFYYLFFVFIVTLLYYWKVRYKNVTKMDDISFAVLVDCGSSGSRLHAYHWRNEDQLNGLPVVKSVRTHGNEIFTYKIDKPLSSFASNPELAVVHLAELVKHSYQYIPKIYHSRTLLYILATGGMRLLPVDVAEGMIKTIREKLPKHVNYVISDIEIISGTMEGVFMWIALNYVLNSFQAKNKNTHGSFEIGGASIQIAFEVDSPEDSTAKFVYRCPETKARITKYVFSTTFLGLGANSAYKHYMRSQSTNVTLEPVSTSEPCLPLNCHHSEGHLVKHGTGHADQCFLKLKGIFDKYMKRKSDFQNLENFEKKFGSVSDKINLTFFGLSELWYSFYDFLHYSGPLVPEIYWKSHQKFCQQECSILKNNQLNGLYKTKEPRFLLLQCFKVSYVRYLIEKFVPPGENNPVINIQSHNGRVIEWTLGAIVYYLSQKPENVN